MNRLFYFLASVLFLLIILLLNSIFFGTNSYGKKSQIINENNLQQEQNDELKKQNDALEFEIQNAQKSKEHVENFAREKLNLVYPDEEFITFKEEDKPEDEK
ncbi:MAG: septum formation initiator family protein [Proteobacteria bacterium]|nr:septum formation initiator family protein [Pseudomonadota bacterium]NCX10532.1 septum formation initiator family protein [Pseudomonadota bacterium]NCX24554.1 septum formation initiator family protein [Pseudomonadota bacterium]NCX30473.1 septum formation initiator family protein [Pseudomonadota bacterium]NCX34370.1 septum formation initiator family protein [Pseudomonadota bacterium]